MRIDPNHEPLYKRLPYRDKNGRFLGDFMMLIPGLRQDTKSGFKKRLDILHAILDETDEVVFADLNVPLNLLWISVRSRPGITTELFDAIRKQIPEARIIGHSTNGESEDSCSQETGISAPMGVDIESRSRKI